MKIFFDARWTKIGRHDGISRFGANLVEALHQQAPLTMLISDLRQLELLPKGIPYVMVNAPLKPAEILLPFKLNRLGADIVYTPMQLMGSWGRRYKLIFTLHDVIYYKYPFAPTYINPLFRLIWWAFHQAYWPGRRVLNAADVIATVSQTSKHEIAERHLTDRPIVVVYNAASELPRVTRLTQPTKELVFMGTLMPYKNAAALIQALPLLPDYTLHLTGRGTPDRIAALKALAQTAGVADRLNIYNGATDQQYADLLGRVTASVSASRAEGFGLPVIEAMASGVPFIGTDMPIFHEVGGEAALYFDPAKPAEFAGRVHQLEDPTFRAHLVAAGYLQAKRFSWDESAAALLAVMRQLVGQKEVGQ